jgi:phosphoglucosamine mutase
MPDNGIKFFARGGGKLDDSIEEAIEKRMNETWVRPIGADVGMVINDDEASQRYIDFLLSTIKNNLEGLKVVVDCANGASSFVAPEVYARAGAQVIAIHNAPNGININDNCGSTHIEDLIARVKAEGADIGVAHDGDADRVLAVDHEGNVIDGDFIMAILATHKKVSTVVGTVMSNLGFMKAMKNNGIEVITTAVGDRYVLEAMVAGDHILGGEQSGHLIMREYAKTGDGALTALQLMSIMSATGKSLKELASVMERFPQVLINVKNVDKSRLTENTKIWEAIAQHESALGENGRILVRPSGTESLVRVMVEAQDEATASSIAESISEIVRSELS